MSTSTLYDNQPEDVQAYVAAQCPDRFLFLKTTFSPSWERWAWIRKRCGR